MVERPFANDRPLGPFIRRTMFAHVEYGYADKSDSQIQNDLDKLANDLGIDRDNIYYETTYIGAEHNYKYVLSMNVAGVGESNPPRVTSVRSLEDFIDDHMKDMGYNIGGMIMSIVYGNPENPREISKMQFPTKYLPEDSQ